MQVQRPAGETYWLYALTVSGVAYLLHLRRPFLYISGSNFPTNDVIEVTVQTPTQIAKITSAAATSGCLLTGRMDGSISCYQLGKLDPKAPGFIKALCCSYDFFLLGLHGAVTPPPPRCFPIRLFTGKGCC